MDVYRTDEQQIEWLRGWWKDNGTSIIFGVLLGTGAIFGWRYWQGHVAAQAEAASLLYQQLTTSAQQSDGKKAAETAARIVNEYSSTGYAILASAYQARRAVDAGDLEAAATHLEWAIDQGPEASLRRDLVLKLARVRSAQARHDEALALLDSSDAGEFAGSYDELRGDIQLQRGDSNAARIAWERALAAAKAKGLETTILELKLDNLGRSPGA